MICPNCNRPYFFILADASRSASCLRCGHEDTFRLPDYSDYHQKKYLRKNYARNTGTDPQMRKMLRELNVSSEEKILDIGCGIGDYTKEIYKINQKVIGLDRDVEEAKRNSSAFFQKHDCNNPLPFPDNSIDKIVSVNLIEHLHNFEYFLGECRRVLKKGGKIGITTANLDFFLHAFFYDETHMHEWTLGEFQNLAQTYFEIELLEKSSSMFKYYPLNSITTLFLKPDLLLIGTKL